MNSAVAVEALPATGKIVAAAWDFDKVSTYQTWEQIASPVSPVVQKQRRGFGKPGMMLRAYLQRAENAKDSRCPSPKPRVRTVVK